MKELDIYASLFYFTVSIWNLNDMYSRNHAQSTVLRSAISSK